MKNVNSLRLDSPLSGEEINQVIRSLETERPKVSSDLLRVPVDTLALRVWNGEVRTDW